MPTTMLLAWSDNNGEDHEEEVPSKWVICERCRGNGKHDHPAFANGITSDEWNGPDWDDDSREGYLEGRYDVRCEECSGSGKVQEPDLRALSKEDRESYESYLEDEAEYESYCRAKRDMGA